jgi:hypothetical protein
MSFFNCEQEHTCCPICDVGHTWITIGLAGQQVFAGDAAVPELRLAKA